MMNCPVFVNCYYHFKNKIKLLITNIDIYIYLNIRIVNFKINVYQLLQITITLSKKIESIRYSFIINKLCIISQE